MLEVYHGGGPDGANVFSLVARAGRLENVTTQASRVQRRGWYDGDTAAGSPCAPVRTDFRVASADVEHCLHGCERLDGVGTGENELVDTGGFKG